MTATHDFDTTATRIDDAIGGIDHVIAELSGLYNAWVEMGVDARSTDWLLRLVMELGWHRGRLTGR